MRKTITYAAIAILAIGLSDSEIYARGGGRWRPWRRRRRRARPGGMGGGGARPGGGGMPAARPAVNPSVNRSPSMSRVNPVARRQSSGHGGKSTVATAGRIGESASGGSKSPDKSSNRRTTAYPESTQQLHEHARPIERRREDFRPASTGPAIRRWTGHSIEILYHARRVHDYRCRRFWLAHDPRRRRRRALPAER